MITLARFRKEEHLKDWCIDLYLPNSIDPRIRMRSLYDNKNDMLVQLNLIFKYNKNPIRLLEVKYKNKVVRKWENLNIGT